MIEKKCQLTKEQCDRLEDLRMGLWDKTFLIQKNSKDIKNMIEEIQNLVARTEQYKGSMLDLNNMINTADFLTNESGIKAVENVTIAHLNG